MRTIFMNVIYLIVEYIFSLTFSIVLSPMYDCGYTSVRLSTSQKAMLFHLFDVPEINRNTLVHSSLFHSFDFHSYRHREGLIFLICFLYFSPTL